MLFPSRVFLPVLFGTILSATSAGASEIPPEWDRPRQEITDTWRVRKEVISLGTDPVGAKQLDQIQKSQRKYGLTAIPLISLALLREDPDSEERLHYAEQFAPDLPEVSYARCDALTGLPFCLKGLEQQLSRFRGQMIFLANSYFAAVATYLSVCLLFLAFLLVRHGIPLSRELSTLLRYVTPGGVIFLTVLTALAAWLYVGWAGLAFLFFFLFWRPVGWRERSALIVLWVLAFLLPLGMYAPALLLRYDRDIAEALERPLEGVALAERASLLQRWVGQHPDDAEAFFTLGVLEKETGRLEEARTWYRRSSALRPSWHKPVVNLANLSFLQGDPDEAIAVLQKAILSQPQSVTAHFNLGRIYLNETRLDEARASLKRAKDIDAETFANLDRRSDPSNPQGFLIDESLSREEIHPRIWGFSSDLREARDEVFRSAFPVLSVPVFWILLAALLVVTFGTHQKWPAKPLPSDSRGTDLRARSASHDLFDPGVSRAFKREYSPLHAFGEEFQNRWCTFLVPGLHHLFRERFLRALCTLFLSVGLLVLLFGRNRWVQDPNDLPGLPGFPSVVIVSLLFGILYLYEGVRAIRS